MLKPNGPRWSHGIGCVMKAETMRFSYRIFDVRVAQHEINKVIEEDIWIHQPKSSDESDFSGTNFSSFTFPVHDVRKSSLRVIYDRKRFALIPRGGSTVILLPFCKIITGNIGLGILVSHNRKSLCTWKEKTKVFRLIKRWYSDERERERKSLRSSFIFHLTDQMINDLLTRKKMFMFCQWKNADWEILLTKIDETYMIRINLFD